MKRIILFFTAVVLVSTAAFAAPPNNPQPNYPTEKTLFTCLDRDHAGLPALRCTCEMALLSIGGCNSNSKCCFQHPQCNNSSLNVTCESLLESGQLDPYSNWQCCWASNNPLANAKGTAKSGDSKNDKKTPIKTSVKAKKVNTLQPVKANATKVPAQTKADTKK